MTIVRPRLTDYYGIAARQEDLAFAIPFLDEDIPLHVDPFLLWKSPSLQDNSLHNIALASFNHLALMRRSNAGVAEQMLIAMSECDEVGLGTSHTKRGKRLGQAAARKVLDLFDAIPEYASNGFKHLEEVQFFVESMGKDRISDILCNLLKSFLIDYTIQQCKELHIPLGPVNTTVYDHRTHSVSTEDVLLPLNPETGDAIILVPKHWLRYTPWINSDDFYSTLERDSNTSAGAERGVLTYNRQNYDAVRAYVSRKEAARNDCRNDPLFTQIPLTSARASLSIIRRLPTGIQDASDKKYEREASRLMASLLYPHLDFATVQSRTEDGVLIRDLIFYNNKKHPFLSEMWDTYNSKQLVMELKNVMSIERDHINQLNRYLTDDFGKFGILLIRNRMKNAMMKNTTQLWAGQRRCIITLTDDDLDLMVNLYESRQRDPLDVITKNYAEFMRACPA